MCINLRIKELREQNNLSQKDFSFIIGVDNSQYSKIEQGKLMPTVQHIMEICSNFDVSGDWLLTGNGEMSKNKVNTEIVLESHTNSDKTDRKLEKQDIPIYDIHAAAGLKLLFDGGKQNVIDSIRIPNMSKCDGAMFITGDSMYPLMKSGDIVLFKQIHNIDYLHFGDIYILSYDINGDEYLVIKYIQRSDIDGHIKLVSYNKYHEPIDIPLDAIRAIALVKANVRYNTMQ